MRKFVFLLLLSTTQAFAATNFDQRSFLELSAFANQVQSELEVCAHGQNLKLHELYLKRLSSCDPSTRQNLKSLKDSFKLFTLSSLVEEYGQVRNQERISPLLIQLVSERISTFKLNETKKSGGNSGIGLCTGFISIGICSSTPVYETSPVITEEHIAYLNLFDLIPETQCDLGLFPVFTVSLINEIASAQGLTGSRMLSRQIRHANGVTTMFTTIPGVLNADSNSGKVLSNLGNKFTSSCNLRPINQATASDVFRSLVDVY